MEVSGLKSDWDQDNILAAGFQRLLSMDFEWSILYIMPSGAGAVHRLSWNRGIWSSTLTKSGLNAVLISSGWSDVM